MKENTVLHALMYIFKSQPQSQIELESIDRQMTSTLSSAGFEKAVVDKAIQWIMDLSSASDIPKTEYFNELAKLQYGTRVYTTYECDFLNLECRRYLLVLEQRGILTPANRERVITQTIALHDSGIDLHLMKWVTMMVLYNQPDAESRQLAEVLALEEMEILYN